MGHDRAKCYAADETGDDRIVRARFVFAVGCVLAVAAFAPAPARAAKVCAYAMPADMVTSVSSGSSKAGQQFRFRIGEDVQLEDGTAIPSGTTGYGIVRAASSAGRHNRDGMLALEPRYLVVPSGASVKRVDVTMNPTLPATWSPSEPLLNKAASHVPLPVPGLVMTGVNTLRWGRNITLGPGFRFTVIPVGNLARGAVC
jgi:hypothetical protein